MKKRQNEVKRNIFLFDEVKKHSRTSPDVQFKEFSLTKQKTRHRTDCEWIGKTINKKIWSKKFKKKSKNQSEIAACEHKTTSEKANFCSNTDFSLYFRIRAMKFHAAEPLALSLHFMSRRDQNHYSNVKNHENVWTDLKKTAPQYTSNSLNCKKQKR